MENLQSHATLDKKETEYFKAIYAEAVAAENLVKQAQNNFAQKNTAVMGFMQYMAVKYNLPNGAQITPEGEIVLPQETVSKSTPHPAIQ